MKRRVSRALPGEEKGESGDTEGGQSQPEDGIRRVPDDRNVLMYVPDGIKPRVFVKDRGVARLVLRFGCFCILGSSVQPLKTMAPPSGSSVVSTAFAPLEISCAPGALMPLLAS